MTDTAPAIDAILSEHADLERQLSDPNLHADAGMARKVGRRFAQLTPIVATHRKLEAARGDLERAPFTWGGEARLNANARLEEEFFSTPTPAPIQAVAK